ncbi:MAG: ATP-binding cassette domain-containing protein [Candidatus Dormibacteraeota bacterium]|uniref:ABC transporter ATP-binding protein n=1 Tax=Candidatus Aeolococcus gillhamiae TaxID=3127015 RepID=A0A2W6ADT4_9BACT|nr:ATP-binding cassette domain-containing protein [Candidatus Dormibacteraeota bacterium]PZR81634.1 MAG: ABC transporter ATP-binding protein [Candidatus Dormibacter sp. RRmetagenome_bin12]
MSDILVRTNRVSRTYGALVAVDGISCQVSSGQRIVITGPSGSGKSTLLHLLAGLETPSSGSIEWPGVGAREQLRPRAVATIFQGPSLLPPLTVIENVALPLLLDGADEGSAAAAAAAALASLGIEDLAGKMPEELSGGQAQRVAVARVLAGAPRLVFADEPTGQLDHPTAAKMLDVLDDAVSAVGATLVLTTHDRRVAERYSTKWSMADGRLHGVD